MENKNKSKRGLSRRKFLGSTATIAAFSMIPAGSFGKGSIIAEAEAGAAPDSKFGGVQIGAITYSWRSMPGGVENIIKYCNETGISSIELMSGDVEEVSWSSKESDEGDVGSPSGCSTCRNSGSCSCTTRRRTCRTLLQVLRSVVN